MWVQKWQWISHKIDIRHPMAIEKIKILGAFLKNHLNSTADLANLAKKLTLADFWVDSGYPKITQEYPRITQEYPSITQEYPRITQEYPRFTQELPKNTQELHKNTQELHKNTQELPKNTQDLPKNYPRISKNNKNNKM